MAKQTDLDPLFLGTDFAYRFQILNLVETAAVDITGRSLSWMLKRSLDDPDSAALLTKSTSGGGLAISGTYDADPEDNEQRAIVSIADTDTDALQPKDRHWELKCMDPGAELVYAYGIVPLVRGVHRS